ncbi:hypothetical protein [Lacrimispora sp.]|uniref:hypothetical protein n=1 Tax=Lacrimispora sp. TaxID=2719234 RepID=UPI0028A74E4C|nr:hypothetical protein [Lacrimispora sp.]
MPMRLNGSVKTGKKIMDNLSKFELVFDKLDDNKYFFTWTFDGYQNGHICIVLNDNNEITQDSLISCKENQNNFKSSLGLYKDDTLMPVFQYSLSTIK